MKNVFFRTFCFAILLFTYSWAFTSTSVHAAQGINRQIPFHGTLTDKNGKELSGTFDIAFCIYEAPTGGTALWTGTYATIAIDGSFTVMLGSGEGNNFPDTLNFANDAYYLGITIGSDSEMIPRERLGATPYAFNARTLDGQYASDFQMRTDVISIDLERDTSLLTLKQTGTGQYMSILNESDAEIFSVRNSGLLYATSLEVEDTTLFRSDALVADGSGLLFGGGNGLGVYNNMSVPSDLVLMPVGESSGGDVRIVTPGAFSLRANMGVHDTGSEYPALVFAENGLTQLINLSIEETDTPRLELSYTGGTEVTDGGLRVSDGGITVTDVGVNIQSGSLTVQDGVTLTSLSGNGEADIAVDDNGNIILGGTSDERLKENIETIDDALNTLLRLRGVRYEWKDKERYGTQTEIGFIAQEVEEVVPEVVRDTGEHLRLNTKNLLAVIVEAVKELYAEVDDYFSRTRQLEEDVRMLRAELNVLKGDIEGTTYVDGVAPQEGEETLTPDEEIDTESTPQEAVPPLPTSETGNSETI